MIAIVLALLKHEGVNDTSDGTNHDSRSVLSNETHLGQPPP
jgi:hypothetical protein